MDPGPASPGRSLRWLAPAALAAALVAVAIAVLASGGGQEPAARRVPPAQRVTTRPAPPRHHLRAPVPVLMYHAVGQPPPGTGLTELYVAPETFEAEMLALRRRGMHGVTLAQVEDAWTTGAPIPSKPVVISFDDGYSGQYENAFPVLRRLRWPATLDLTAGNLKSASGLTPTRVREMLRAGWELAAHTISHPDLRRLDDRALEYEVAGSRRMLRRMFHVPVDNFCYPAGDYDQRVVAAVKKAGYRGATTVAPGLARRDQPFEMRRIRVNRSDGPERIMSVMSNLGT